MSETAERTAALQQELRTILDEAIKHERAAGMPALRTRTITVTTVVTLEEELRTLQAELKAALEGKPVYWVQAPAVYSVSRRTGQAGSTRRRGSFIETPPGLRLNRFARFVFPKRIYEKVLKPCLAETQEEHAEALHEGSRWKAKWIRYRGVLIFWWTVFAQIPVSVTRMAQRLWTISGG